MPITISCSACDAKFAVRDELAGKRIRCVQCSQVLAVPAAPANSITATRSAAGNATASGTKPIPTAKSIPTATPEQSSRSTRATAVGSLPAAAVPHSVTTDISRSAGSPAPSAVPADFELVCDQVMSAFERDQIERIPVAMSYRIGILLVAIVMLLLPLIYLSLIALAGWGVYYHAVNHTTIMSGITSGTSGRNAGRALVASAMLYLAPIFAGGVLVLFMLKPLFSRPSEKSGRRSLNPDDEPLLFEFVDRVCDAVRSPKPRRIDIDCNVNASASFGGGVLSMLGNDLVLTIGMPLVAGLDLRQFAGVLAHEFGHFAQGAGMRMTYLIRSISYWFTRVVYERDHWDERLETWSTGIDFRIGWMLYATRLAVWCTRRILWVLMMTGHAVSGYMLRQMEFDADRHEARVAGSRTFARTAKRLALLNVAHQGALSDLSSFYSEGRLGDNLPKLILLNIDQLPPKMLAKIDQSIAESKTGLLDTHPADSERIRNAELEQTNGIFRLHFPALALFRRFEFHSRAVTWDFYKEVFGKELRKDLIHPVDELVERQKAQLESHKALRRFFQGMISWYRPFPAPSIVPTPENAKQSLALLKRSREEMTGLAERYYVACRKHEESEVRRIEIGMAHRLNKVGVRIKSGDFSIPLTSLAEIEAAEESLDHTLSRLESRLKPFEDAAADRLHAALSIAHSPKLAKGMESAGFTLKEVDSLLRMFSRTTDRLGQLLEIRDGQIVLGRLLMLISQNSENAALVNEVKQQMEELHGQIQELYESLKSLNYPFDHARADISVAEYMLRELPTADNPVEIYEAADTIGNALPTLQIRVLGRLCQIAEHVETVIGITPLPDPPEDDDDEVQSADPHQ